MIRATIAALMLIVVARPARADDEADARRYFAAGEQAYEAGEYLLAATAFEEAYRLTPRPGLVFTMAQAYRRHYYVDPQVRWIERARDLYRQYLDEVQRGPRRAHAVTHLATIDDILRDLDPPPVDPPPPPETQLMVSSLAPDARASIDGGELVAVPLVRVVSPGEHVVRIEAPGHDPAESRWLVIAERLVVAQVEPTPQPARLEVRAPDGAEVVVDGRAVADPRSLEVPAGSHAITVTRRGHRPLATRLELGFGEVGTIDARTPATRRRRTAWWLFGGAGATLVAAGVTSVLALVAQDDAQDLVAARTVDAPFWTDDDRASYNDAVASRDRLRVASGVLFGGAVAVAAVGAALFWFDRPTAEAPPPPLEPAVRPVIGPDTIGAAVGGSF